MDYGLYLSASGVLTNLYRQDVFANNLANAQTVGFKPDIACVLQRPPESVEEGFGFDLRQDLLDKLGGGVFAGPQHINFEVGRFDKTQNPLDVALKRSGDFFAVSTINGKGQAEVWLTRDGRFTRSADGHLVTVTGGHRVLDVDDAPIVLGAGPATIDGQAKLRQNGNEVAQIQVAYISDTSVLRKQGGNMLRIEGDNRLRQLQSAPSVLPGFVESSGTDPIRSLMKLIAATKAVTANGNLIRYHDTLMDRAVNVLGRVVA